MQAAILVLLRLGEARARQCDELSRISDRWRTASIARWRGGRRRIRSAEPGHSPVGATTSSRRLRKVIE